jgi:hypothetical protein
MAFPFLQDETQIAFGLMISLFLFSLTDTLLYEKTFFLVDECIDWPEKQNLSLIGFPRGSG